MNKNLYVKKAGQSKPCNDSIEGDGGRMAKVLMYPCAFRLHQFRNEAKDSNPRGFSPFASIILNC